MDSGHLGNIRGCDTQFNNRHVKLLMMGCGDGWWVTDQVNQPYLDGHKLLHLYQTVTQIIKIPSPEYQYKGKHTDSINSMTTYPQIN